MSAASLVAASNRKRVIILVSAVLVFLLFITFRPTGSKWSQSGIDSSAKPPVVAEGPPKPPAQANAGSKGALYDENEVIPAQTSALAAGASKNAAAASGSNLASAPHKPVATSAKITTDEVCKTHAKTDDMLVIMKTGATEAYDKLPIHFLTTLRCANDTILFSDMDMEMGGHHIIDVLKDIKPEIKKDNPDFKLYDMLQNYHDWYEDPRSLKNGGNGWNLDKYKFNQMMLKTWQYREDADWYVFIEADTYVVWDSLRTLLDKYDPNTPMYIGSPTYLDIEFAHGGTGYVISRAAMKRAVGGHPDITDKYDKEIRSVCCGDRFIARILLDEEIKLTKTWPMFNGEKPLTLPYGQNHWCQPIITMHHMTAQEVSQVWTYEQYRKQNNIKGPILIKDVYEHFVRENLDKLNPPVREDWNNLSWDVFYKPNDDIKDALNEGKEFMTLPEIKRTSVESPQNCARLCDSEAECYGWMHKDNECKLSRSIKIGGHQSPDGNKRFVSGWNMKAIHEFIKKMDNCPNGPDWFVRGI